MAGRTAHEAHRNYVDPLQLALSCVTRSVLVYPHRARRVPGEVEALTIGDGRPVRLARRARPLFLSLQQEYEVVQTDLPERGPWKVSTRAYRYRLDDANENEIASWHWHPRGRSREQRPHLHVAAGELTGCHLPTGRVSVEAVVRLLLSELGVTPRRDGWRAVLDEVEERFKQWRTWA